MNYKRQRRRNNNKQTETICQQIGKTTKYANISEQLQSANTGKIDNMTETTIREITTKCPYRPKTTSANTGKITTMRQHRRTTT